MRYKAKSVAALQLALGSLPNEMQVEVDPEIDVSAKTVGDPSQGGGMACEFGGHNPDWKRSPEHSQGEQG
jgi:hypothetical protein